MRGALARSPLLIALTALVLGFVLAPLGVAVAIGFSSSPFLVFPPPGVSLRWFQRFLGDPEFTRALGVSLRLAAAVTAIGVVVALCTAFGLARLPEGRARGFARSLILAPLLVPVVLLALGLLLLLASLDLLGASTGLALAHLLIVIPLCVATIASAMDGLNPEIEQAAASLGASPVRAFLLVTLPQIATATAGAAALSFMFSLNDVTFAAFLGGPDAQTLPLRLFAYVRYRLDPLVGAVSTLFVVSTLALIVLVDRVLGFDRLVGLKE